MALRREMSRNPQVFGLRHVVGRVGFSVQRLGVATALILLCALATATSASFLTAPNLLNVVRQVSMVGVLGIGMTFVILTGGIDLSVGAVLGVCAVLTARAINGGQSLPIVIVLPLLVGTALGLLNGLGVSKGRIPPFIMTLAMLGAIRGVAYILGTEQATALREREGLVTTQFNVIGEGSVAGVPIPVIVLILTLVLAGFVLRFTRFGRQVLAVGGNSETARLAGINIGLVKTGVYAISGLLSGLAAIIWVARVGSGHPIAGTGIELDAITAVLIGGTSLTGGEGTLWGTLIGALLIGVLGNFMNLLGVQPFLQVSAKGALLIAVLLAMQAIASFRYREFGQMTDHSTSERASEVSG